MDERHSDVPTARASLHPLPVRRSVIPMPADAVERRSLPPSPTRQARRHFAAFGLLLASGAALGFHASLSDADEPSGPVFTSHPVRPARRAPVAPTSAPTGFSNLASDKRDGTGTIGGCIAMATMLWSGSGAVDPSAFTGNLGEAGGGSPSTVDGICRFTAVIRPA